MNTIPTGSGSGSATLGGVPYGFWTNIKTPGRGSVGSPPGDGGGVNLQVRPPAQEHWGLAIQQVFLLLHQATNYKLIGSI
jgi:hypothetical protein